MDIAKKSSAKTLTFESDGYVLKGTLHLPDIDKPPIVIGCHGLLADRKSPKQKALANTCTQQGIAFFRFDHRGCGESQGEFEFVTSLEARCRDLTTAIRLIRAMAVSNGDIGLFGSSMGGSVCIAVAAVEKIAGMVTFAAPLHSRLSKSTDSPLVPPFDVSNQVSSVGNIHVFHGECDETVPLTHAEILYAQAAHPKAFTIFSKGDHRMSNGSHQDEFLKKSGVWFTRCFFPLKPAATY